MLWLLFEGWTRLLCFFGLLPVEGVFVWSVLLRK